MLEQERADTITKELSEDQGVEIAAQLLPLFNNPDDLNLVITKSNVWGDLEGDCYGIELIGNSEDAQHNIGIYIITSEVSYFWKNNIPIRKEGRSNYLIPELYEVSKKILDIIFS